MKKKHSNKTKLVILVSFLFALSYNIDANSQEVSQNQPDDEKTDQATIPAEQKASANEDLRKFGEKYHLPKSTMKDLYGDINESDSMSSDADNSVKEDVAKTQTKFTENSRIQSIPIKDVEQLIMINDNHKDQKPFSIMTVRVDSYRLSGDSSLIKNEVEVLKNSKSLKEFKDNLATLNNVEEIETKQRFPVALNSSGYVVSPSAFEMINSRSFFNEDNKLIENKPYGYAFYVTSPVDSKTKLLFGAYDNPCSFADQNNPVCYQNSILEDISIKRDGVLVSPYNDVSNTQMVLYYQTDEKVIP